MGSFIFKLRFRVSYLHERYVEIFAFAIIRLFKQCSSCYTISLDVQLFAYVSISFNYLFTKSLANSKCLLNIYQGDNDMSFLTYYINRFKLLVYLLKCFSGFPNNKKILSLLSPIQKYFILCVNSDSFRRSLRNTDYIN